MRAVSYTIPLLYPPTYYTNNLPYDGTPHSTSLVLIIAAVRIFASSEPGTGQDCGDEGARGGELDNINSEYLVLPYLKPNRWRRIDVLWKDGIHTCLLYTSDAADE